MNRGRKLTALLLAALMVGVPGIFALAPNLNVSAAPSTQCTSSPSTTWVVDSANNRVLEFVAPFSVPGAGVFSPGQGATVVIGQNNFLSAGYGTTATSLKDPVAAAFDSSGNLWVADQGNNRILEYQAPFTNGMAASFVIGQTSFTSGGYGTSQSQLKSPSGLAFDSQGNLWVADQENDRVMEFGASSLTGTGYGPSATLVIGQATFNAGEDSDQHSVTAATIDAPSAVAFDSSGNLWVTDQEENRVLEFVSPFSNGMSATVVLGHANPTTSASATTQNGLNDPYYMAFDPSGNLWVSDLGNSRIVEYQAPFSTGEAAGIVLGTSSSYTVVVKNAAENALNEPMGIAFDAAGNLWIADSANNRVLEVTVPIWSGSGAALVLGQSTFHDNSFTQSQYGFDDPTNVVVTGEGTVCTSAQVSVTGGVTTGTNGSPPTVTVNVNLVGNYAGYLITIIAGDCSGETNVVVSNTASTLTLSASWTCTPDTTSLFTLSQPVCSTIGPVRFRLAWVNQVDPVSQSTMFITDVPQDAYLSHAVTILSSAPSIYVVRLTDGNVLYHSQSYNVRGSQYGIIPNQQFTLSGVGVPVSEVSNSYNVAWLTTSAASPNTAWLQVEQLPVNQGSGGTPVFQAISLSNLINPSTGLLISLNPVSLAFTPDGSWIVVGATAGWVAAFTRSC